MKSSTLFTMAALALSQITGASAAANPTRVLEQRAAKTEGVQKPSTFPITGTPTSQGCFSAGGNLTVYKLEKPQFQSSGSCGELCVAKNFDVMALHGSECMCGTNYPPENKMVKDSNCNFPCPGFPEEACGSLGRPGFWSVFNTGENVNVEYLPDEEDDDSAKTSSSASATSEETSTAATAPAATTTDGDSDEGEKKSGPNTAGIAAGVVVGVAVIAGGIGGFFFWMRRRRNAEIEEDHRRNAAVNAFINGSKPPSSHGSISMTDSRLDPVMAHRRMSDGSIADNEDYSRRILRVTNA